MMYWRDGFESGKVSKHVIYCNYYISATAVSPLLPELYFNDILMWSLDRLIYYYTRKTKQVELENQKHKWK